MQKQYEWINTKARGGVRRNKWGIQEVGLQPARLGFGVARGGLVYCSVLHHRWWHTTIPRTDLPTALAPLLHLVFRSAPAAPVR
ncbi:hypothetical protein GDO78_010498 [Eleutherodactylus coqui]|uniref:Uncharacterized protein n=1 Tax=Eleutherodactylus coqui TaxID=57060 RepID=A0A8J6F615_ELECQ|nr:hypothetical protein GDO78_010498 [Eleutherodactylus coqui]